jgi:hypothetical protein
MAGRSKGNKQVDKNAAKDKSADSNKSKRKAKGMQKRGQGQVEKRKLKFLNQIAGL